MALVKDDAIVLRRLDYSETSQVLVLFSRTHGQVRLIAKGVKRSTKKRASTGIDLLERGSVVFSHRPGGEGGLATMTEWRQSENFPHLQRDLRRLYAAQYAAEVTAQLTEVNDPHAALFDALAALLSDLAREDSLGLLVGFLWDMLREIGLQPDVSRCMGCGRSVAEDRTVYFSSREGGAICRDCEPHTIEKRRVDGDAIRLLLRKASRSTDGGEAGAAFHAFELVDYHLTETMGKPARLRTPLLAVLSAASRAKM